MSYQDPEIQKVAEQLKSELSSHDSPRQVLRDVRLRALSDSLKQLPADKRADFGKQLNNFRQELESIVEDLENSVQATVEPIDVTAPFDVNVPSDKRPQTLPSNLGSVHPLMSEIRYMCDILMRMGFNVEESREIDDDYNMFTSLNFPQGHPARDDYDTFMTDEGLIAPAHTSTMQNRVLKKYVENLNKGEPIAVVIPDRVFRNEDLDDTHEHTFYQLEGVFVAEGVNAGHLIATLRTFLSEYFGQDLKAKLQPFYFPFTEPSFEFAIERPLSLRKGDSEADMWLELMGCGMIHPNVLEMADIDPSKYSGFAWGVGIERLVMMKNGIEDIRHFQSGKLEFLRQFK